MTSHDHLQLHTPANGSDARLERGPVPRAAPGSPGMPPADRGGSGQRRGQGAARRSRRRGGRDARPHPLPYHSGCPHRRPPLVHAVGPRRDALDPGDPRQGALWTGPHQQLLHRPGNRRAAAPPLRRPRADGPRQRCAAEHRLRDGAGFARRRDAQARARLRVRRDARQHHEADRRMGLRRRGGRGHLQDGAGRRRRCG